MKFKAPSLSLRSVILLAVVVGIAAPALALLAYSDAFIRRSLEPVLEGQRAAVLTLAANGLVEPLWTVDSPAVQRALDQLLSDVNVCAVELNEERVDTRDIVRAKCSPGWPTVTLAATIQREGQVLGSLRVQFDDAAQERMLDEGRRQTALIVAAQVAVGVGIVLMVFYLRMVRPIDRLKRLANAIAERQPVPRLRWNRKDELGQLGVHLDQMGQQIAGLLADMESKNAQLHQLAMYDHLTGLRTALEPVLDRVEQQFVEHHDQRRGDLGWKLAEAALPSREHRAFRGGDLRRSRGDPVNDAIELDHFVGGHAQRLVHERDTGHAAHRLLKGGTGFRGGHPARRRREARAVRARRVPSRRSRGGRLGPQRQSIGRPRHPRRDRRARRGVRGRDRGGAGPARCGRARSRNASYRAAQSRPPASLHHRDGCVPHRRHGHRLVRDLHE